MRTLSRRAWLQYALASASLGTLGMTGGCEKREDSRIGAHTWIGYEPLFLAKQSHQLPTNMALVSGQNAADSMQGLLSGRLDGAALTLDEVIKVRADGIPLTVVLVFDISAGADQVIARPAITTPAKLKGKRLAYEASALGELMLSKLLAHAKLNPNDLDLISLAPNEQLTAWRAQSIDAAITYEPTASKLLSAGGQLIFDSRQLPETIMDVLAVRTDRMHAFADNLRDLIRVHFQMLDRLQTNPGDTLYQIATRQNVSLAHVRAALSGVILPSVTANIRLLQPQGKVIQVAQSLIELMQAQSMIDANIAPKTLTQDLVSAQWMPKVIR